MGVAATGRRMRLAKGEDGGCTLRMWVRLRVTGEKAVGYSDERDCVVVRIVSSLGLLNRLLNSY